MFWKKKEEPVENPFEDKVKCNNCRCWIDKFDAQVIPVELKAFSIYGNSFYDNHYCRKCKVPYKRKFILKTESETITTYYKEFEVDESGELIKK